MISIKSYWYLFFSIKRKAHISALISIIALVLLIISCEKRDFKPIAAVVIKTISDTMATTATITGEIIDLGEGITNHGHCWSLSDNPTVADSEDALGIVSVTGIFTSKLKNLEPGKTYHVKAYAKSGGRIFYSTNNLSFTTLNNPLYVSSAIGNDTPTVLEMKYNITLANIIPDASAFTVMVNNIAISIASIVISGTNILLTLSRSVGYSDVVTVAYKRPANNPLQSVSGGQVASITAQAVTNNVSQVPSYLSSTIGNATPSILEMTYDLTLANIIPDVSAFTVIVNSIAITISNVAIIGTGVQLTLASPVVYGNVVTVAYTKPAINPLQTSSGGQAISITAQYVTNKVNALAIGDNYQGGIIAYILQPGEAGYITGETHGLIVAPIDQGTAQWSVSFTTTGATATALGTGNENTNTIVSSLGLGNYAARLCYDLVLGGYADWYLPSKDELNKLYINKTLIGGFDTTYPYYWSSSESSSDIVLACDQWFDSGSQGYGQKNDSGGHVRAVRTF